MPISHLVTSVPNYGASDTASYLSYSPQSSVTLPGDSPPGMSPPMSPVFEGKEHYPDKDEWERVLRPVIYQYYCLERMKLKAVMAEIRRRFGVKAT
jgi:hypothetical protein